MENGLAPDKAVEPGDSDLIYTVLLQIKRKLPLAAFFCVINARPAATDVACYGTDMLYGVEEWK